MKWKCNKCGLVVYCSFKPKRHEHKVVKNNIKTTEECFGKLEAQLSPEEFLKQFKNIQEKSFDLVKSKNSDYGFSFIEDGYEGVLVRMTDKINRIRTISSGADMKIKTENLRDTIMDLQNYCTIAMICLDNDLHSSLLKINKE